MHRPSGTGLRVAALAAALLVLPARAQPTPDFLVIVNPANPVETVTRRFLTRAFLGVTTRWPENGPIEPVDQSLNSSVRRVFSEQVLGRSAFAVHNAWVQAIFEGSGVPPPVLDSDAKVVSFVLRHPGAIGYVSPNAHLRGARVVEVK